MPQVKILAEQNLYNVVSGEWDQKLSPVEARAVSRIDGGEGTPVQLSWAGSPRIVIPSSGEIPYWQARLRAGLTWADPATDTLTSLVPGESYMPWRFRAQMNIGTLFSVSYEAYWYVASYDGTFAVDSQVNWFTFDHIGATVVRQDCPTTPTVGEIDITVTHDPLVPRARAQMTSLLWDPVDAMLKPVTYTIDFDDPPATLAPGPIVDFRVGVAHQLESVRLPAGNLFAYVSQATAVQVPAPAAGSTLVRGISAETCGDVEC